MAPDPDEDFDVPDDYQSQPANSCEAASVSDTLTAPERPSVRSSARPESPDTGDGEEELAGPAPPPETATRKPLGRKRPIRFLVLLAVALPPLFFVKAPLKVRGQFDALPIQNADVRSEVDGIVAKVYVDEGQTVHAGDVIAQLSDLDLQAELRRTEAEIAQNQANLKKLQDGPTSEDIAVAKAAVTTAQDHFAFARDRLKRDQALFEQGLLSRKDFEDTQDQAASARNDLNSANLKLRQLLAGSRPEDIEATKANIAWSESQRRLLREQIQLLRIVSPINGVVATPSVQLKELTHQLMKKGELIAKVYDCKTVTAEICVSEKDIADVRAGQKILLRARAVPERTFQGRVTLVAPAAQLNSDSAAPGAPGASSTSGVALMPRMVRVTTQLDNRSLLLKPGMTGQAKIYCAPRSLFALLTRRLARTFNVEFWSWW